ncbi:PREDICTED: sialin-like [Ceratosolen solmsi marchali]|uniref:Sialin n=1 Tax=Ceratosolen solmsi marchali TaxID=326594 RepID=A0AAJ7E3B0_9HYME|nr:PREDICTED: sialin-like [Ceratosolen solmsi marchali]
MIAALTLCCAPIAQRWIFALMGFLALVMAYGMRVSLSITITEMVKPIIRSDASSDDSCPVYDTDVSINKSRSIGDTYEWDEYTQGIILSSFYWGYVVTQLPGALIAEKFGGKHTLGFGILSTAVLTFAIPVAVEWGGSTVLIILRVLMGFGEGVTLPALNVMLAQWTPPDERSKTGSFVYVGAPLGTVFATALSGLILNHTEWPMVFYFFGGMGLVWYLVWIVVCYNTPREHPFITEQEAKYLDQQLSEHAHEKPAPVPWRHLLTSMPLWALILVQVGHDWGFYTVATDLPKYMSSVLHFSVEKNGYLSSLPYVGMWLCCVCMSWVADWLISNKRMSITMVRKLGTTIASVLPGLFIVSAAYAGCDRVLGVSLFTLGVTFLGTGIPSLKVNALDLSPNYAGTVMAISNGAAACTGILTPYVVGVLTPEQTLSQWRLVFWIIFIILMISNVFYLIFASGDIATWNDPVLMKKNKEEKRRAKMKASEV